jgi:signal peptidase I
MIGLPGTPAVFLLAKLLLRRPLATAGMLLTIPAALFPWRLGVVSGHSMEPTLPNRSLFIFDHAYYRKHPVGAGEIVVLRDEKGVWIKRVYAIGGDRFWAWREPRDGHIRHDPIVPEQRDYFENVAAQRRRLKRGNFDVVRLTVPKDAVFVVGDGAWSEDSRDRGYFRAENIIGRVTPLPGQDLGKMPEWTELSSPRAARLALGEPSSGGFAHLRR